MAELCSFEDCGRLLARQGLCEAHYQQKRYGKGPLAPIKYRSKTGVCEYPSCGGKHDSKGLCAAHARIQRRGEPLRPLIEIEKFERCVFDGCEKNLRRRGHCSGHYTQMRQGLDLTELPPARKPWWETASNKEEYDKYQRIKASYGLSEQEYLDLITQAGDSCSLCSRSYGDLGSSQGAVVDHDHVTGRVRGIICGYCNTALGFFKDDQKIIESAISYLQRYQTKA